jgi:hypothetical protein
MSSVSHSVVLSFCHLFSCCPVILSTCFLGNLLLCHFVFCISIYDLLRLCNYVVDDNRWNTCVTSDELDDFMGYSAEGVLALLVSCKKFDEILIWVEL